MEKISKALVAMFLIIFVPVSFVIIFSLAQTGFKPYVYTDRSFCGVCLALKYEKQYSLLGCSWSENIYQQTMVNDYLISQFPKIYGKHLHHWLYISGVGGTVDLLGQRSEKCSIGKYRYVWMDINNNQELMLKALKHIVKKDRAMIPYIAVHIGRSDLLENGNLSYLPMNKKISLRLNKALRNPYFIFMYYEQYSKK